MRSARNVNVFRAIAAALSVGAIAAAVCVAVAWAVLDLLVAGAEGLVGSYLSGSANGVTAAAAAATGGPVDWWSAALSTGGRIWPARFLLQGSPLVLVALGPVAAGVVAGLLTGDRRRLLAASAGYATVLTATAAITAAVAPGPLATVSTPAPSAFVLGLAWCFAAGLLGQAARRVKVLAAAAALLLTAQFIVSGSAVAAPTQQGRAELPMTMAAAGPPEPAPVGYLRPGVTEALAKVGVQDAGNGPRISADSGVNMAKDPWLGVPTMLSLESHTGKDVKSWLRANAGLFAAKDPVAQLRALPARPKDPLGLKHDWFQQEIGGVPVYGARVGVHRDAKGKTVRGLTNYFIPDLEPAGTKPTLTPEGAVTAAARAMPGTKAGEQPELLLLPDEPDPGKPVPAALVWRVPMVADDGRSTVFYVDALSTGRIVKFEPGLLEYKQRSVWDLDNNWRTDSGPARTEGQGPVAVDDVNKVYDNSGHFYDYMMSTFGRDSWDGEGGEMNSYARYSNNGDHSPVKNAFFDPLTGETMFGEGTSTLTIVAHEWTHGVTFTSANLFSFFQGGSLHESFSDVFAAFTEYKLKGSTSWKAGEGSSLGVIRDLANPHAISFDGKPHPAHYSEYWLGCLDGGWVHFNSLIPSHAWYILATRIGIPKTAEIAYRDLTVMLAPRSRFSDTRSGAIQAASDLYGKNSPEMLETWRAFGAVGIDGTYESPRQFCLCFADESLSGVGLEAMDPNGSSTDATVAALLRLRGMFENAESGATMHYAQLYSRANSRAMDLLTADDDLRRKTAHVMQSLEPAFRTVGTSAGDRVVITQTLVNEINSVVDAFVQADEGSGGDGMWPALARSEREHVNIQAMVGMTANQGLAYLDSLFE
ncbi:M4 family metallopeptidase [Microtetraspora sp. AC03309]|uniref:M4 family metallopeptidase n=1 Tax=Microtetraspora sp. AC03309 TaxID=2779376 RepID=UPI001E2AD06D|nr:M4 family metallopeptidase [Microtetraspora sp. AC03309]MCC5581358.1 M4 family metallopeptidase [Microtetraspora sp. AC03309]